MERTLGIVEGQSDRLEVAVAEMVYRTCIGPCVVSEPLQMVLLLYQPSQGAIARLFEVKRLCVLPFETLCPVMVQIR